MVAISLATGVGGGYIGLLVMIAPLPRPVSTNRILNSVKTYGNIVAFRNLEDETNAALELFGNREARGVVLLKPYQDYYREYTDKVTEFRGRGPWSPGGCVV